VPTFSRKVWKAKDALSEICAAFIRKVRGAARLFARADLSRNASLRAKIRL
jgi:hypothetical protein